MEGETVVQRLTKRNALKQYVKMYPKSIMVLTEEEHKIYRELRRGGLNPYFPSHVREVSNYAWKISKCQVFLRKVGHKQELGYDLKQLTFNSSRK